MELLGRYWWWPVVLVLVHFGMNGCFGCWEQERIALLQFKASTINYADEYYFPHWDSGNKESDCCEWERVKCNTTIGRVIQLDLSSTMSLSSAREWYFNASLFLPFEELQYLDLSWNGIRGWVPNEGFERFSLLSKLEVLQLSTNYFNNSILQSLSGIASLKELDLSWNNLNGSIHIKEFKAFSNLEDLYLSRNDINDFVTTRDSNILTKLQLLDLSWNSFNASARVPESLTALPSLKTLNLQYNNFEGSFTTKGWCELKKLQEIGLDNNNFEGRLPSCLANWTSLRVLDLSYNYFNGNIVSPLSSLTSVEFLCLSNNDFLIPSTLSFLFNLSNLKILLGDNNIFALEPDTLTWIPTFQLKFSVCQVAQLTFTIGHLPDFFITNMICE